MLNPIKHPPIPKDERFEVFEDGSCSFKVALGEGYLIEYIRDRIILKNCCDAAIMCWTEEMMKFSKPGGNVSEEFSQQRQMGEARDNARLWREYKKTQVGEAQ